MRVGVTNDHSAHSPSAVWDLDPHLGTVVVVDVVLVVVAEVTEVVVELESIGATVYLMETVPISPSLLVAVTE